MNTRRTWAISSGCAASGGSVASDVLAPYVGTYQLDETQQLDVTMREGVLFVRSTGGAIVRLWAESPADFFIREVDAQLTFVRDDAPVPRPTLRARDPAAWLV